MKKKSFTLAEVLITLTIIGVIAALTIPNLMQSYKKHQVEVGIKEAYSILSNAFKITGAENGTLESVFPHTTNENGHLMAYEVTPFLKDYLLPHLKYNKFCPSRYDGVKWSSQQNCTKPDQRFSDDWGSVIYLANGMIIYAETVSSSIRFQVDLNGVKGPNKLGSDTFAFSIFRKWSGAHCNVGYVNGWCNYRGELFPGHSCNYEFCGRDLTKTSQDCAINALDCTIPIMKNGWKIPDDYPIKKF